MDKTLNSSFQLNINVFLCGVLELPLQLKIHLPTSCSAVRAFYSNLLNQMVVLCHMWTSTVSHSNVLCHVVATRICFHRSLIHLPSIFPRSLSLQYRASLRHVVNQVQHLARWSFNRFSQLIHSSYSLLVNKNYITSFPRDTFFILI